MYIATSESSNVLSFIRLSWDAVPASKTPYWLSFSVLSLNVFVLLLDFQAV